MIAQINQGVYGKEYEPLVEAAKAAAKEVLKEIAVPAFRSAAEEISKILGILTYNGIIQGEVHEFG